MAGVKGNFYNLVKVLFEQAESVSADISALCSNQLVTYQRGSTVAVNKGLDSLWTELCNKRMDVAAFLDRAGKLMDGKFTAVLNETIHEIELDAQAEAARLT